MTMLTDVSPRRLLLPKYFIQGKHLNLIYTERAAFFEAAAGAKQIFERQTGKKGKEMSLRKPKTDAGGCFMRSSTFSIYGRAAV